MNKMKFLSLLVLAAFAFTMVSCGDDDKNKITITIEEPTNGEVITDCADVHIHIDIDASEENHEVEIVLHPEGDTSDKILDHDMHEHDKEIKFEQEVDLCDYPAGTCFHLEVVACVDHDCGDKETADVEFCLPQ